MRTYAVKFSRYNSRKGEMRLSGVRWITAESFAEANGKAQLMLSGMRDADPGREYDIAILDHTRELRSPVDCSAGIYMFETADELTLRLSEKGASK